MNITRISILFFGVILIFTSCKNPKPQDQPSLAADAALDNQSNLSNQDNDQDLLIAALPAVPSGLPNLGISAIPAIMPVGAPLPVLPWNDKQHMSREEKDCETCDYDLDCDDINYCTIDKCFMHECVHEYIPGCAACSSNSDCNDFDVCSQDVCTAGICSHTPIPGCAFCSSDADCPARACNSAFCSNNICSYTADPSCTFCDTASDCDSVVCNTASCVTNECTYTPVAGCSFCALAADCPSVSCNTASCLANQCIYTPDPGCSFCSVASDCPLASCDAATCEANECTYTPVAGCSFCLTEADCPSVSCNTPLCVANECFYTPDPGCSFCSVASDCPMTSCDTASCIANECTYTPVAGCSYCATASDCQLVSCNTAFCIASECFYMADAGCSFCALAADCPTVSCNTASCVANECIYTSDPGCSYCTDVADCNDGDACTLVDCLENQCTYSSIPGCAFCTDTAECSTNNVCIVEDCVDNQCTSTPVPGCAFCDTPLECNDLSTCTADMCIAGRCAYLPIPGCSFCTVSSECRPGPTCTMAVCDSNVCTYPLIPGCVFLVSIVVTPVNLNLPVGAVQQYTATGIFSDATMADITTIVSWSSSNEIVAHISNAPGFQAQATMLSPGLTTITATLGVQGSTSLSVGCYDAPSNLVGWWPGNLNANDVIAGNNGTWSGAYIPGEVQEAFDLPGTQTPFVSIPNSAAYETQVLTLDAWINAGPQGNFKYIIAKGFNNDCASASSYAFYTGNTGGLFFYVSDGASAYLSPGASPSIWDNNWHFVAGVYDGLRVSLYVDGVLVPGSIPQSPVIQYNFDDNSLIFGTYPGCNLNYNGGLDEVEIFNRALTSTEIQNIYLAGSFGKCNP